MHSSSTFMLKNSGVMINTRKAPSCRNKKTGAVSYTSGGILSVFSVDFRRKTHIDRGIDSSTADQHILLNAHPSLLSSLQFLSLFTSLGLLFLCRVEILFVWLLTWWKQPRRTISLFALAAKTTWLYISVGRVGNSLLWNPTMPAMPGYRWQKYWTSHI